jgi:hypothetical protein
MIPKREGYSLFKIFLKENVKFGDTYFLNWGRIAGVWFAQLRYPSPNLFLRKNSSVYIILS